MTSDNLVPQVADVHLDSVIGEGASGVVWRGVDDHARPVAVKVIPYASDAEVVEAAAMEFAALSAVAGAHMVRVHRAVPVGQPEPGLAIVMDLLEGGSLRQVVADRGRMIDGELVTVLSPIAAAVGALHSLGLVHGDLSPSNILFDLQGRPHVSDLGTAAIIGDDAAAVWGTDGFVAPEVLQGAARTAATDVYALAALGWFAATGHVPGPAIARPALSEAAPQISAAMAELIQAGLAGEPAARPDAVTFANAIFEVAPATPLRLRISDDDVSSLTRRIREAATAQSPSLVPAAPSAGAGRWGLGRFRPRRVRSRLGRLAPSSELVRRAGVVAIVAMVALTVLGLGWLTFGRTAQAAHGPQTAPTPGSVATPATPAVAPSAAQSVGPATPAVAPSAAQSVGPATLTSANVLPVVQGLLDARAALWNGAHVTGAPIDLKSVHAKGSASWRSDEQVLAAAAQGGYTYAGVVFTATSATLVGTPTASSATVRVVMNIGDYAARLGQATDPRQARSDQRFIVTLQHTTAGWRISDVHAG